jgi:hypothetical protein
MLIIVQGCSGDSEGFCSSLPIFVFITRCGLNLSACFIFVIHTEIFPTFFLVTSYGLCNFFGRSFTLAAPILAENPNKMLPLTFLMIATLTGVVGSIMIRKIDDSKQRKDDDREDDTGFD